MVENTSGDSSEYLMKKFLLTSYSNVGSNTTFKFSLETPIGQPDFSYNLSFYERL